MQSPRGSWSRAAAGAIQRTDGGIFWWAIAITVLLGAATFSWFFCILVFTHPEKPMHYALLSRFNKLEPIRQFTEKDAPGGKSYDQRDLYQTFYSFTDENLAQKSTDLRRAYITNYKDERPVYVKGRFRILQARPLKDGDMFTSGVVARAVALSDNDREYRNVVIEYILPTREPSDVKFGPGDIIEIDTAAQRRKRRLYATLLNVHRQGDDSMVFTVVPLVYGEHAVDADKGIVIKAEPPKRLNLGGSLPVTTEAPVAGSTGAPVTVAGS